MEEKSENQNKINIKFKKINSNDYSIKLPKKKAFSIETPEDQLRLHQLQAVVAGRGTGKGVILSSLLQGMKKQNVMDRIFILSPTIDSNRPIFENLNIKEEDEYHSADPSNIVYIIKKCNQEADEWEEYLELKKLYNLIHGILDKETNIDSIDPNLLIRALESGILVKEPISKYGHKPILGLIVDDFQGSNLYSANPKNLFINMCLRHRHIARGMGVSIFMCMQTYAGPSGLPRTIRQNLTSLLLGPQKNLEVIEQIADEVGGQIEKDKFMSVFNEATKPDHPDKPNHNFLLIDFHPKNKSKYFRKNLNEYLITE